MKYSISKEQSYITDFVLNTIKGVRSKKKLTELWSKELLNIYRHNKVENEKVNENCYRTRVGYVNVKTVIRVITLYRTLIIETYSKSKSYEKCVNWMIYNGAYVLIEEKGQWVKTKTEQKRGIISIPDRLRAFEATNNSKNTKHRRNNNDKIQDVDGLVNRISKLNNSTEWYDVLIWLAYVTGRRMTEIVSTCELTRCKGNQYNAWFSGQIKTRNDEYLNVKYKIPLLAKFSDVKEAISYLRSRKKIKQLSNKTREQINKSLSSHVNLYVKKYTKEHAEKCSFHTFRAIYALLCVETMAPSGVFETEFVSHILGHDLSGKGTTDKASKLYQLYELTENENTVKELSNISYAYERKD